MTMILGFESADNDGDQIQQSNKKVSKNLIEISLIEVIFNWKVIGDFVYLKLLTYAYKRSTLLCYRESDQFSLIFKNISIE